MGGRGHRNFYEQFLHVEIRGDKGFLEAIQSVRAIGQQRLFNDVMKHLFNECVPRLFAADGKFSNVVGSGEADGFAVIRHVIA